MTIAVTGTSGHLGRLVVESLLARGAAPADVVALARSAAKVGDLAARGVVVREADYDQPETLAPALDGVDVLVLVSGSAVGQRVRQHGAVIDAAKGAGVGRVVYTSAPHADTSPLVLAPEHKATEELLAASGLSTTVLRNGWYTENYLPDVQRARETGELVASVGEGRVASASRADYAEAAAVVALDAHRDGSHDGAVHELSGDVAWDFDELARTATEVLGRPVTYRRVTSDDHRELLLAAGLDEGTAGFVVALDGDTREGLLAETSGDLARLIGRPTTPLAEGLRRALDA
ncbi:SDR family oxidoreductase [Krasilnikoviella flava]|uniref:NAD(P)H dehydrogenase (Quinone) n=1 Tax=Krasilnikoviella flava TaxID=526729 RepID=A0A1T5JJF6_9MICO|nr:SDR family oxidoreductase [Krasilnikoviella flava]SKC51591.1 NAD(P)H dehydrogenase (quinone) [Krasilnikoviella flava]